MAGEVRAGAPKEEALEALPASSGEILERQFDVLSRHGLQRLLAPKHPIASGLVDHGIGEPLWFERDGWRVFAPRSEHGSAHAETMGEFQLEEGEKAALSYDRASGAVYVPFDLAAAYQSFTSEGWQVKHAHRRLSTRQLNAFYRVKRFIPRSLQLRARRLVVRWQGRPEFPSWPLDRSVARLLRFYAFCLLLAQGKREAPFRWFWPNGHHAALVLTHDVETEEGLRLAVDIADLEEELGFRSSFNLGGWYRIDDGVVRELENRGFEIGVHGLRHDRSLFSSRESFEGQQPALRDLAERLDAVSFRSPATHRVVPWIGELPFDCDCSMPHSDPFEPQPGGCCSLWPFFLGDVVELPYTMPQDHTLFTLLGHRTPKLWVEQAARIEDEYGMILCVTHPDRGYLGDSRKRTLYAEFLREVAERRHLWRALPRDASSWWRARDDGEGEYGVIRIGEGPDEVVFDPPSA